MSESLPSCIPIFPLSGALLLPSGHLPLNIFEPRYLAMTRDAMRTDRIIGIVQPSEEGGDPPKVYRTGCAGRITTFSETEDGRYLINLTGVCRFDVERELDATTPYRQVVADYMPYMADLEAAPPPDSLREPLLGSVRRFFDAHEIQADWGAIERAPLLNLVTSLSMICPFEASEKQALLEAANHEQRAKVLIALFEMGTLGARQDGGARH